ncbi:hypothetical protein FDP41_008689 [Naegleria fowleri]|uniref:GB1/RHD3-type G domain-containing protein n=1 Tax=Naegleria fowleri TaxID=5763 RepID=A0A6A5BGA1_NAEFO|nr:uncharacterized protein FDP41_008689 [Naegleria fowleri]KAF0973025.1 hypothetical protein FDP41_008689 [Naegleria fowleri]
MSAQSRSSSTVESNSNTPTDRCTHTLFSEKGLPISSSPFLLFRYNTNSAKWEMNEQAKTVLSNATTSKCILHVVSVVGAYRLGKSYLMNRLLHHECTPQNKGFELGHSIHSHTKGVWAWGERSHQDERHILLCLDTEGLLDANREDGNDEDDDDDSGSKFDTSLFCLMTMLSSTLIFNFSTRITSDDVRQISFAAHFSTLLFTDKRKQLELKEKKKHVKKDQNEEQEEGYDEEEIVNYTPRLIWLIRDMTLALNGTEKDYLDSVLQENTKTKKNREKETNKTKTAIKKFFKNKMELLTIPPPTADPEIMKKIEYIPHKDTSKLSALFVEKMELMVNKIRSEVSPKKILSPFHNTEMFLTPPLLYHYCSKLLNDLNENSDKIDLPNAFEYVLNQQVEYFMLNAEREYEQTMKEGCEQKFPMEEFELLEMHTKVFNKLCQESREEIPSCKQKEVIHRLFSKLGYIQSSSRDVNHETANSDLKSNVSPSMINYDSPLIRNTKLETLIMRNRDASHEWCEKIYEECLSQLRESLSNCENIQSFMDLSKRMQQILLQKCVGPARANCLSTFSKELVALRELVYHHLKIKESERQIIELREHTMKLEQEKAIHEEEFKHEKQVILEAMKSLERQQEMLREQMEQERRLHSQELQNLRSELNSKASSSSAIPSSHLVINKYYYDDDDDDYFYGSSSRRSSKSSSSSSNSGKKFYKGGQFLPGGGRAPKGGIWM